MVDNLAEKVDECPLNQGRKGLFAYNRDCKNSPLSEEFWHLLFRGCLIIEVNGRTVGTFISWVSAVEGCLLSRAPL